MIKVEHLARVEDINPNDTFLINELQEDPANIKENAKYQKEKWLKVFRTRKGEEATLYKRWVGDRWLLMVNGTLGSFFNDTWNNKKDIIETYFKCIKINDGIKREKKVIDKTISNWVGQEKDKIQLNVKLDKITGYDTEYGYMNIYIFADAEGNKLTWNTKKDMEWKEGQEIEIKATVKEHYEYNSEKQTSILRVKEA